MISVHELKDYMYCPRLYYYEKQLGLKPINEHVREGMRLHKKNRNREINELFFSDGQLKGKIDYLTTKDKITLWELKKGNHRRLWHHHKLQALSYMYLAKKRSFPIHHAIVKYQGGSKFKLNLEKKDEQKIKQTMKEMKSLQELPPRCEDTRKCFGCNMKEFCWS